MMKTTRIWLSLIAAALLFAGCSSTAKKDDGGDGGETTEAPAAVEDRSGESAQTSGASQASGWQGNPLDNPDSLLYSKVVYFDFDQSDIRGEYVDMLRAHADYLNSNRNVTVTIEGHCDERGSREYNIGLGERRANAVKSFLQAEGVSGSQINTISYGEERPADLGHDESAWSRNRRGVLVY